jgi:hypothetical protein
MTAIFGFQRTQTLDTIPTCLTVLPDFENVGIAEGISQLSYMQAEIYNIVYGLPVMASISVLPVTLMSHCSPNSPSVLLYSGNVGIPVVGLLSLLFFGGIFDVIYVLPGFSSHVEFTIHPDVKEYQDMSCCVAVPQIILVHVRISLISRIALRRLRLVGGDARVV